MIRQGTRFEVHLDALTNNYTYLRQQIPRTTMFCAVVKADAYGHGMIAMAHHLKELGADYFAVAYVDEGIQLRKNGITTPTLVFHMQAHQITNCIKHKLEPVIYSLDLLGKFIEVCQKHDINAYPIHLEINTGLNRIGIEPDEIQEALQIIKSTRSISVKGLQSHLAASEDRKELDFTQAQIALFNRCTTNIEAQLGQQCIKHICNTSGILNFPQAHLDMVRTGIGLYGYGNDAVYQKHFRPVGALYASISQVRPVKKGQSISYNRSHIADRDMTYAVISIGHGDGVKRVYGYGGAVVFIHGQPARTLGIICMDMFMVDVSDIPCKAGDEVLIFGEKNNAQDMAEEVGIISYELLTGIQKRVPRKYLSTNPAIDYSTLDD